ncbi:LapA family protein [Clostridiaceae bacterium M8S5]|nr:LapA family protein [Clostridiaceae bacterium M8S5]
MQAGFIGSLIFAILITIFALQNATAVDVKILFTTVTMSQALVILVSASLGAIVVAIFGLIREYKANNKMKELNNNISEFETKIKQYELKISELESKSESKEDTNKKQNVEEKKDTIGESLGILAKKNDDENINRGYERL